LIQDQKKVELHLKLENAEELGELDPKEVVIQEIECSGEFPVKRRFGSDAKGLKPTPYMHMFGIMGGDSYLDFKKNILSYLNFRKNNGAQLRALIDLYVAGNYPGVCKVLSSNFKPVEQPDNITTTTIGFYDLLSWVTTLLLPPKHFELSTIRLLKYFGESVNKNATQRGAYVQYLYGPINIGRIEADGLLLLERFLENFELFIPVLSLSYCSPIEVKKPYGKQYLVTTTDADTIKQFYADTFEWLCRGSSILMGAENIRSRGNFDHMPVVHGFEKTTIKTLYNYVDANNGIKKIYLGTSPNLKKYFTDIIDNEIRNAINHYKTVFDPVTQIIDYYPFKGKKASESKSTTLIDLTDQTFRQIAAIHDLLYVIAAIRTKTNK